MTDRSDDPLGEFLPVGNLLENRFMPDPFVRPDGKRVATLEEWPAQREYLKRMLSFYLWGSIPPKPSPEDRSFQLVSDREFKVLEGRFSGRRQVFRITITRNGKSHSFEVTVVRPPGEARCPTLIQNYKTTPEDRPYAGVEAVKRGFAFVQFNRKEIAPDLAGNVDRSAGIFPLYPEYGFRTIAAWAWAVQPVIDLLDHFGIAEMDKIIMTGHSRGGQTAVAAAILDDRIAMVCPSAGSVYADMSFRQRDPGGPNAGDIVEKVKTKFPHWHHPRHHEFIGRQNALPFDAATWFALVAPRPFLSLNGRDDPLNNNLGVEAGVRAGQEIYRGFNAGSWCRAHFRAAGVNQYGQTGHVQGPEEFNAIFDFAEDYFFGRRGGTAVPGAFTHDPATHPLLIDWTVPPLAK